MCYTRPWYCEFSFSLTCFYFALFAFQFVCLLAPAENKEAELKRDKDITYMWNLKKENDTNELIYKPETDSQSLKTNLWLLKGKCEGEG